MDLDIQVARLKTLKTAYSNEHYRLEDAITQGFPAEMRKTVQQLENAKADTIRCCSKIPSAMRTARIFLPLP